MAVTDIPADAIQNGKPMNSVAGGDLTAQLIGTPKIVVACLQRSDWETAENASSHAPS
jgi:hypothetical protein